MLEINELHAGYDELEILKGITLHVNPGEIVALIGPNGAGKTTVIKSIFSLANVRAGKIIFKEKDITRIKTHELIELGISYVNQGRIIFKNLNVKENLLIGADFLQDKDIIQKDLDFVYKKFPILKQREDQLAFALSGGQQQMLAIGRALMQNPSLLLLDEPSLGLSPKLQKELFAIIQQLKDDGISLLIVEQNAKKAIEIADRTYLLEDGNIALEGGKEIIKHKKIKDVYLGGRY
ncbi:ABC transporter ATP-binding protein [Candidatus Woesearchaeota archaeon]|nr:ABC transporter ATP-binding protein [Candidatus Woesearchaeota archaeon]